MIQVHRFENQLVLDNVFDQRLDLPVGSSCRFFLSLENPLKNFCISFSRGLFKIRRRREILWRCNIGVDLMLETKSQSLKVGVALQLVEILAAFELAEVIVHLDQLQIPEVEVHHALQE